MLEATAATKLGSLADFVASGSVDLNFSCAYWEPSDPKAHWEECPVCPMVSPCLVSYSVDVDLT